MSSFSKRNGFVNLEHLKQGNNIDYSLSNHIWNGILLYVFKDLENKKFWIQDNEIKNLAKEVWMNFLDKRIDLFPVSELEFINSLGTQFNGYYKWYMKFDLIEFLMHNYDVQNTDKHSKRKVDFKNYLNLKLEQNLSIYRVIDSQVVAITDDLEIDEIERALNSSDKFHAVHLHLKRSIELFSDKNAPDYRNSIKEAISAVESICCLILDDPKVSLGKALSIMERTKELHPSLKKGFSSIYGFTSDANGIRHKMLESDSIKQEDARFMIVACSAFVNYLKQKGGG